jgi:hypothetical protein
MENAALSEPVDARQCQLQRLSADHCGKLQNGQLRVAYPNVTEKTFGCPAPLRRNPHREGGMPLRDEIVLPWGVLRPQGALPRLVRTRGRNEMFVWLALTAHCRRRGEIDATAGEVGELLCVSTCSVRRALGRMQALKIMSSPAGRRRGSPRGQMASLRRRGGIACRLHAPDDCDRLYNGHPASSELGAIVLPAGLLSREWLNRLPPSALFVLCLVAMRDHVPAHYMSGWPEPGFWCVGGDAGLAERCGVSRKVLTAGKRVLRTEGLLDVERFAVLADRTRVRARYALVSGASTVDADDRQLGVGSPPRKLPMEIDIA